MIPMLAAAMDGQQSAAKKTKQKKEEKETVETRPCEEGGWGRDERENLAWIRTLDLNSVREREREREREATLLFQVEEEEWMKDSR